MEKPPTSGRLVESMNQRFRIPFAYCSEVIAMVNALLDPLNAAQVALHERVSVSEPGQVAPLPGISVVQVRVRDCVPVTLVQTLFWNTQVPEQVFQSLYSDHTAPVCVVIDIFHPVLVVVALSVVNSTARNRPSTCLP